MKKIIALIIVGVVLLVSCAHQQDLSEDDISKYRKARQRYDAGQKGGP
jgi:PBP1b-binding outer membrane lipoprotein LpoB